MIFHLGCQLSDVSQHWSDPFTLIHIHIHPRSHFSLDFAKQTQLLKSFNGARDKKKIKTRLFTQMKWLVFGSRGWIGSQLCELLKRAPDSVVVETNVRTEDAPRVHQLLDEQRPDRVLMATGRTHGGTCSTIDYLEQKGKLVENVRDNLEGPLVVALACWARGIHLTYLGTGCIFAYDSEHPMPVDCADPATQRAERRGFVEEDRPNFVGSSYSVVKGSTDRLLHLPPLCDAVLNVRIRMPITADANPRNFLTKICNYRRICSVPNSMTVLPQLLPLMADMARHRRVGTINLVNPGVISHNQILDLYRQTVDPAFEYTNFSVEEQNAILAAERSNNHLDTSQLQKLYPDVLDIRQALRRVMEELRDKNILLRNKGHGL